MILKSLVVCALGLAFNATALAGGYGVVDIQKVILSVDEGKNARADPRERNKSERKRIYRSKEELDKMNKEWSSQAALMSDEAKEKSKLSFKRNSWH